MHKWYSYQDLYDLIKLAVDLEDCDHSEPSHDVIFDRMVQSCAIVEQDEEIGGGSFYSGMVMLVEREPDSDWSVPWLLVRTDDSYELISTVEKRTFWHFSHQEPEWQDSLTEFLSRTWWRPVNADA